MGEAVQEPQLLFVLTVLPQDYEYVAAVYAGHYAGGIFIMSFFQPLD